MIRLRQIALVAHDLDAAIEGVRTHLGVDVCFRDPGVAEFGLRNALFRIGDQFLEMGYPYNYGGGQQDWRFREGPVGSPSRLLVRVGAAWMWRREARRWRRVMDVVVAHAEAPSGER